MLKRILSCYFIFLFFASTYAEEWDEYSFPEDNSCAESCDRCYFNYMKLGGSVLVGPGVAAGPAIGIGRRYLGQDFALDLSVNYGSGVKGLTWGTPKIMYLQYFEPECMRKFYAGGGLSWGGLYHQRPKKKFTGLMAEFAVGVDLICNDRMRTFLEFNLSQPLLPTDSKHSDYSAPALSLCYGVGF